jgi:hypothetical protein
MRQRATKVVDDGAAITARAKAVKVSDVGPADVLVGTADGGAGLRWLDVAIHPLLGGGLRIEVEVPLALAQPVLQLIAAVKAGERQP